MVIIVVRGVVDILCSQPQPLHQELDVSTPHIDVICMTSMVCWALVFSCLTPGGVDTGSSSETEAEVERAFQQAVQASSSPEAGMSGVQLATAIHDMEIDRLLQKLVCGEIEYNPHDPSRHDMSSMQMTALGHTWTCMESTKHNAA